MRPEMRLKLLITNVTITCEWKAAVVVYLAGRVRGDGEMKGIFLFAYLISAL